MVSEPRRVSLHEVVTLAVERGTPVMQRTSAIPMELGAHSIRENWLLAVPDAKVNPTGLALVARSLIEPFSSMEIARVQTIMAIRRASPAARPVHGPAPIGV